LTSNASLRTSLAPTKIFPSALTRKGLQIVLQRCFFYFFSSPSGSIIQFIIAGIIRMMVRRPWCWSLYQSVRFVWWFFDPSYLCRSKLLISCSKMFSPLPLWIFSFVLSHSTFRTRCWRYFDFVVWSFGKSCIFFSGQMSSVFAVNIENICAVKMCSRYPKPKFQELSIDGKSTKSFSM